MWFGGLYSYNYRCPRCGKVQTRVPMPRRVPWPPFRLRSWCRTEFDYVYMRRTWQ